MAQESIADQRSKGGRVSRPLAGLALYRERGDEFRSLGGGRYEVPSRRFKSKRYEINIERETCDCLDHQKRGRTCAHVFAVVIAISKPARIPSRERFRFSAEQIESNLARMTGGGFLVEEGESP